MAPGRIRTIFDEPITADKGLYDVNVRYFDENYGRAKMKLYVNRMQRGGSWISSADDNSWKVHTIPGVTVNTGDEIMVEVHSEAGEYGKLDYVHLNYKGASRPAR